jgi:Rod binding domain-containing protein
MLDGLGSLSSASLSAGRDAMSAREGARLDEAKQLAERVNSDPAELRKAAQAFEALFASMLVKEMRATLAEGFFGAGPGADTYSGMLDEKVGETLAESELFGVQKMLELSTRSRAMPPEVAP